MEEEPPLGVVCRQQGDRVVHLAKARALQEKKRYCLTRGVKERTGINIAKNEKQNNNT